MTRMDEVNSQNYFKILLNILFLRMALKHQSLFKMQQSYKHTLHNILHYYHFSNEKCFSEIASIFTYWEANGHHNVKNIIS